MGRHRLAAVVAAAGALTLGITASVGAQGQGQGQGERTIVVYERGDRGTFKFVDVRPFTRVSRNGEPRRISAGDAFIIRNPVYGEAAGTTRVAGLSAHCTALNGSRRFDRLQFHCQGDVAFADGTIVFEGLWLTRLEPFTFAVVGGTGAYEAARGQVTVDEQANGNSTDTIHIAGTR